MSKNLLPGYHLKQIINLLLSFAPWIAFLVLAGHSLLRLEIALIVAAVLVVVMAITGLHRGAVLWAGYIFFGALKEIKE